MGWTIVDYEHRLIKSIAEVDLDLLLCALTVSTLFGIEVESFRQSTYRCLNGGSEFLTKSNPK
jgi:hypothetical protein